MNIRFANIEDAQQIAHVNVESWITTYNGIIPDEFLEGLRAKIYETTMRVQNKLRDERIESVVCERDSAVVGFATYGREREGDPQYEGELYAIYFLKEYQNKGWGKELFKRTVNGLVEMGMNSMIIWALEDNEACGFYEKMGGKKVKKKVIEIGGKELNEVGYGWDNLKESEWSMENQLHK